MVVSRGAIETRSGVLKKDWQRLPTQLLLEWTRKFNRCVSKKMLIFRTTFESVPSSITVLLGSCTSFFQSENTAPSHFTIVHEGLAARGVKGARERRDLLRRATVTKTMQKRT